MTESCNLWLLLVTFHSLICVAPVYCQHVTNVKEDYRLTFVLSIKNNKSGLQLEVYQSLYDLEHSGPVINSGTSHWPDHELEPQIYFISGHRLSPECGNQYFRCQEVLVINNLKPLFVQNDSSTREFINIVFVPLENGVLLLSFWYDPINMTLELSTFTVNCSDCSPTVFYRINSTFYTVCIRSYEYIAVYEIQLNFSSSVIEGATLTGPLTSIGISNSPNISNLILIEHKVYFAAGSTIIAMDSEETRQYSELPECAQIHKLVPVVGDGNQMLLVAYCTDRYIYFDTVYGDLINIQLFSSSGVPYLCPDSNYEVSNEAGSLVFSVINSSPNITIKNVNVSSGICFKSQNKTYFAYSDQQSNNVFVYDFTTQNPHPVLPYNCSQLDCPQLLLLENQYLIVRDANHNFVLDVTTNFNLLPNISSGIVDILVILHASIYNFSTPLPPVITHGTSTAQTVSTGINWSATSTLISSLYHISATTLPPINIHSTRSTTAQNLIDSTGSIWGATATLISSLDHTSTITPIPPIIIHSSTSTQDLVPSDINWGTVITPLPQITLNSTIIATVSSSTDNITRSSIYSTISRNNIETTTPTNNPIVVHSNTVGIAMTVFGLFVIIIVLVTVAVGFSIQHLKRKWCNNNRMYRAPRIRYITNQSPSLPLLQVAADSAQEEAEDVEGESYEMKSMARESYSKESHFDKGWRWTTTV